MKHNMNIFLTVASLEDPCNHSHQGQKRGYY